MDEDLWVDFLRRRVEEAKRVQNSLAQVRLDIPVLVIYSAAHPTAQVYEIEAAPPYRLEGKPRLTVDGDGKVSVASATHGCPLEQRLLVEKSPCEHLDLCRNDGVLAKLERRLFDA
ncbi:MAG: hypothetical protein HY803_12770 [candidate division NC10 bacterium]|nr:hypothetical protein [candidate division NC10 bacterium]